MEDNKTNAEKLNILVDGYAFKRGWADWPVNFDPRWVINCDGFEQKE